MTEKLQKPWLFALLLSAFIALNSVLIWQEFYWFSALPVAIIIIALAFVRMDYFLIFISFLTPISVTLEDSSMGAALSLPSEPLIITLMMVFAGKVLIEGNYDKRILRHPLTLIIILHVLWMFFTSLLSSMPLVSFKFLISRIWFVSVFFFLGAEVFKKPGNITRFMWAHMLGILIVIIYTTYEHSLRSFEKAPGHWVMTPFYHDHTAYGMILALFLPFLIGYAFHNRHNLFIKLLILGVLAAFLIAFRLSNSRAAWLSVVAAGGVYFLFRFRIRWYFVLGGATAVLLLFMSLRTQLFIDLGRNKQDSSENLEEHIQSISNISTDASNLERINRWNCAISMYEEEPWLGWGPNTYKFNYARFQKSTDITLISTNAGNKGNAHSEYLGPLAEQGIPGALLVVAIIIAILYTGNNVYKFADDVQVKRYALWIMLCFVTYWIHGVLNNFLELDKASVPYWSMAAMLVAMDVQRRQQPILPEGKLK